MRITHIFSVLILLLGLNHTQASAQSVESLLQGQVSGVRVWSMDGSPMSSYGVSIRGVNSLRGGSNPLYVVDGSVLNTSNVRYVDPLWQYGDEAYASPLSQLSFLNPYDIESIEVLKNTSATALYGSKGANGVVIIRTKHIDTDKTGVYWDSNVGVSAPVLRGYSRPSVSHSHKVMVGSTKDRTSYTLSAFFSDENYLLPETGSMKGGLRTSFETKANSVVWFGFNSNMSVVNTTSAAATAWFGSESMTLSMRDAESSPQKWAEDYDDDALEFRAVSSMWLKLNIFNGFSFKLDVGTDYQNLTRRFWWGNQTPFGYDNKGAASILRNSVFAYNASGVFDYGLYVAGNHHLNASVGAQLFGNQDVFNTLNGTSFYNHSLRAKGLNLAASKALLHRYDYNNLSCGLLGTLTYDWQSMAGATVSVVEEFNPLYGEWNLYPSASAYVDFRQIFLPDNFILSSLAVECGYGESGRDDYIPYDFLGSYTAGPYDKVDDSVTSFFDGRSYIHTREWNVNLKAGLLEDRISLEAGYYDRRTADRMAFYRLGEQNENGDWVFTERTMTASQESVVANNGVELSIAAQPILTKDWKWNIGMSGAYNFNRIASLAVEDAGGLEVGNRLVATRNIEGYPVSSIVDSKGNIIGNPTPRYYGSLNTSLRWKELELEVLADGAADYEILNMSRMWIDRRKSVTSRYVENGDFLRLAKVTVAYDVPVAGIKWLNSLKVFIKSYNIAVLTAYSGWTPDVNSFAVSNFRLGIDNGSCQVPRVFMLGASVKF